MEALEFFTNQYAFLSPLLLPWLQKLCHDSAEEQLKMLFETELATPIQLVSCTNFSYRYIRTTIIPRLIQYIEHGGNKGSSELYLRSKLAIHYSRYVQELEVQKMQQLMQQNGGKPLAKPPQATAERQLLNALLKPGANELSRDQLTEILLNARYFELLLTDILNDLCAAYKVFNILCVEKMAIIQYIRSLIYECEKNIKHDKTKINLNSYSGLICCNLLSILNDEYAAECVCDSEDTNLSNFKVFTDIIIENNVQFPKLKNEKENMEIDMEKLQRKLKQQQQQMAQFQPRKSFSHSLTTGTAEPMLKIPHTPQISAVGQLEYRQSNPEQNSDWEDDIDLNNKQIMRGHDLYYMDMINENEDGFAEQKSSSLANRNSNTPQHVVSFRTNPMERTRSQSYVARSPTAQQPLTRLRPLSLNNQGSLPMSAQSSMNTVPSPNALAMGQPPPPPIQIVEQRSLPIGTTKMSHNTSTTTDKLYDSTKNVNIDQMSFSRIQPPKPVDFSREKALQRGLTKTDFFAKYLIDSKIIGQGSFAVVRRCKRVTDEMILAMKIIKKKNIDNDDDMELIRREIQILLMFDHPNIIRVYDWCETKSRLFIVLDFCGGGNVLDRIIQKGSFSEFETAQLIRELAVSMEYYHHKGVVHRDLKPENIMYLDEAYNQMKLIDFGMANTLKEKKGLELSTACGSPLYAAPEILQNKKYGTPVDMWSLGVITYLLLCGFPPFFDTHNIKNVYHLIKNCKYSFPSPFWDNISDQAKDFISRCLVLDIDVRYTANDVLNHPWIKKTEVATNDMLYDDVDTDILPEYDQDDEFSSTDDDDFDSNDDAVQDIDYDQILAEDFEMDGDLNINPLHSPVASKTLQKEKQFNFEPKTKPDAKKTNLFKRAATERVLKKLKLEHDLKKLKSDPQDNKNDDILLKGKHGRSHTRKGSLAYMNQGTIFSAQRDHLQKQKDLIEKEREELIEKERKITKKRQELEELLDEHNEFKKVMTNFEREKAIFNQEKKKWLGAKGSVEKEKERLQKLQQSMTERYESEFDKFVSETQEQRRQLSEEYKRLNGERLDLKQKNEALTTDLQRLHEERSQFEMDRNQSLPTDIQELRQKLENEWLQIAEEQKQNQSTSNKLKKMMNTLNAKETELENDHKEVLEIKSKIAKELDYIKSDEYEKTQTQNVMQQTRELQGLKAEFEAERAEFKQLKLEFYQENMGSDEDLKKLNWKQKYLLMKHDFDKYCDEMDEYCDNLEAKCKEAEDKYHHLYATFDEENTQLTSHIVAKNEQLSKQEERLRELEESEEMWQHHSKETDALNKQLDDAQIKLDRMSDEMNALHDQISNYKAQMAHYVDVEVELDQLKQQMLLIHEQGGTAGITIIPEESDVDDNEEGIATVDELHLDPNASTLHTLANQPSGLSPGDEEAILSIKVGDRVELQKGWTGRIQYIGSVPPIKHEVIGLALDAPIPDGHDGKGLFVCKPQCGYFSQRWRIKRVLNSSTPKTKSPLANSLSLSAKVSENQYKTIRIKITDIDQLKHNEEDGNLADNEEEDDGGLIMLDYKSDDAAPKKAEQVQHVRQFRYIEPQVPQQLNTEKLGWIFHRLRETPIGPLDSDGNNKIDINEFVNYFLTSVNIRDGDIDRSVYEYAFSLIDINGDGEITPLEYYRFFDKYRLFPEDHFVNGNVEYKVLCIKSYGLCATPVNSHIFRDDTTVYFHQSQFQYLIPYGKRLQDRDDTSDEDEESHLVFKSSKSQLHNITSSDGAEGAVLTKHRPRLVNDDTESLYDDAEAEQSALRALEKGIDEEEEDDDIPLPKQYEVILEDDEDDAEVTDSSVEDSSEHKAAGNPLSAPPNMEDIHSSDSGLYGDYIQSGMTPRSPPNKPTKQTSPFQQFGHPSFPSITTIPNNASTVETNAVPKFENKTTSATENSTDGIEKSMEEMMKEMSRSQAALNLKKIGLEMSHEQIEEMKLLMKKQAETLEEEKAFIEEEKLKIQTLKQVLEQELVKLGVNKEDIENLPDQQTLTMRSVPYSVEDEEDRASLGLSPMLATRGHFVFSSAISAIHSAQATLTTLNLEDDGNKIQNQLQIRELTEKVHKLTALLGSNKIEIPKTAMEEEEAKERQQTLRAKKLALVKTESITVVDDSDYSFGMQLFFEQYDVDKFNCITFEGFFEALKLLELDDTPENELRAIFYFADVNENNGLNINEFLYALCVQFLNSILDRKLRLTFGQCDDDFNGALDTEEMRTALDILQITMSETHYAAMFDAAEDAGVQALDDDWDSVVEDVSDEDDDDDEEEEEELRVCDFTHFKYGLLTTQPFACGDEELSDKISDYDQESPTKYVQSLLSLCWHILVQSFDLMDEDRDGLINSRETANVIEYLGITDKAYGDIQTLKGVYKKVINERNNAKEKINFKTFIRVMLQQYFRGISDQAIRCVFESHCQGLMTLNQFINSFETIKNKLPQNRGGENFKNKKEKGKHALNKLFKANDKHNTGTLEWDKYVSAMRECIVFNLEDNVDYAYLFKNNWILYKAQYVEKERDDVEEEKQFTIRITSHDADELMNKNNNNNVTGGVLNCEQWLKSEFDKHNESVSIQDIIALSDEYKWCINGLTDNKKIFEWWIKQQMNNNNKKTIERFDIFKKIIYRIWFHSYFEMMIKLQFKRSFPQSKDSEFEIDLNEFEQFVGDMNFGLNDALIRSQDHITKLCYYKVDTNSRGSINYDEMMLVLQQIALYSIAEFIFLRYKYISHGIIDEHNNEKYIQKEDFLTIARNNMLIFSNDEELDAVHDTKHMLIKICNSSSFLSGLFDKFAVTQYRGDTVKKLNFNNFSTAYLYRLLMELSCFYIDDLCKLSFDQEENNEFCANYDDYISVFRTLGFRTEDALFCKQHCDSLAVYMFGTKRLSLNQFYVFLMNKAMINNLELQIYGSFVEYAGDARDYITTAECVRLVSHLKNNHIIHGKMYSLEKYIGDYLKFWNNHYQIVVFKNKQKLIKHRKHEENEDNNNNKWYFESFLHCLTFHQFQLNFGRSHLLLKAMNLDRQKMKILKLKQKNIKNERLLLNKEKKLHDFYTKMMQSIRKNKSKLVDCKDRILDETNAIKNKLNLNHPDDNDLDADDLLNVQGNILKPRTSALKLAKGRIAAARSRRGSVVVKDDVDTDIDDDDADHLLPRRQPSHFANQISVELQLNTENEVTEDFNLFGGGGAQSDTTSSSEMEEDDVGDIDIDNFGDI